MRQFVFTPKLGWSVSRYNLFETCKRQYYYNYYAKYDPEHPAKKILALKKMTSIPLEVGNIVHDVNKTLLERLKITAKDIDKARFYDYAEKMTQAYVQAKTFQEIYYGRMTSVGAERVFEKVRISLENFLNSDRLTWLIDFAVHKKDEWLIEPPGYGETRIGGMKAYCKVDFMFPVHDRLFIMDWKTGKPDLKKHRRQMVGYTAWAAYHFEKEPAKISPIVAYLHPDYKEIDITVNSSDIEAFAKQIRKETADMNKFCQDVQKNIPKDKALFTPQKSRLCDYCNFRALCD
ncbi:MAG: PD-(D/E)XK nuclease family protein [Deltaproteobacteria bacterium]|nr:PD-(D/E)XK nuclease family protein [Deltaproteobacteria bacterium]